VVLSGWWELRVERVAHEGDAVEINLSRQQFETLLKTMYLGVWMVNGIREPGNEIREFAEFEQHLWSLAHKAGLTDLVEVDAALLQFFPTKQFEDALHPIIDEYDDEAFWDGLVDRLADRDFMETHGDAIAQMNQDERFTRLQRFVDKYETEIEGHGVDRLRITGA